MVSEGGTVTTRRQRCPRCGEMNSDDWPLNIDGQIVDGGCQACHREGGRMPKIYSRRKGSDVIPAGAIYVGRGTPWGNPFVMGSSRNRDKVCDQFEIYARERIEREPTWLDPLRGHDLICWCQYPSQHPKARCHAETLLRLIAETAAPPTVENDDERRIPLNKDHSVRVSVEDFGRASAFKWSYSRSRDKEYAMRKVKVDGKDQTVYLHRFLMDAPICYCPRCGQAHAEKLDRQQEE